MQTTKIEVIEYWQDKPSNSPIERPCLGHMLDDQKRIRTNENGDIRIRRDANRSEVRPRTAEQGFGAAWSRGPACGDAPRTGNDLNHVIASKKSV